MSDDGITGRMHSQHGKGAVPCTVSRTTLWPAWPFAPSARRHAGAWFRSFVMDELARSIDALTRDQAHALAMQLGLGGARLPVLLPGARTQWLPLAPAVSEEDRRVVDSVVKVVAFLTRGGGAEAPLALVAELLPVLPTVAQEVRGHLPNAALLLVGRNVAQACVELARTAIDVFCHRSGSGAPARWHAAAGKAVLCALLTGAPPPPLPPSLPPAAPPCRPPCRPSLLPLPADPPPIRPGVVRRCGAGAAGAGAASGGARGGAAAPGAVRLTALPGWQEWSLLGAESVDVRSRLEAAGASLPCGSRGEARGEMRCGGEAEQARAEEWEAWECPGLECWRVRW